MGVMYESMVFYRSFYEALRVLPEENRLKAYEAICKYGLDGEEIEVEGIEKAVFLLIKPQIDANNKRKENGMKGGRPKTEHEPNNNQNETKTKPNHNQKITETKADDNQGITKSEPNVNVKVNVNDNVNVNEKIKRFTPPTVDEVRAYCEERKNGVDAQQFVDFYSSKGWKVGNQSMKDWKAAVRTWENRHKPTNTFLPTFKPKPKNPFLERSDMSDLDRIEQGELWEGIK